MTSTRRLWAVSGLLALAVGLVFATGLTHGFVWDDEQFVVTNRLLAAWGFLPRLLTENLVAGAGVASNLYRPLQSLTHFLDVRLWGLHPWGHHLTNVLLQMGVAVVVFRVLATVFPLGPAALAAAGFALHPLQVEAVAYVSGRGDLLAILFLGLGLLAFRRHLGASLLCAALAMASKESLTLFPLFLWLYDRLPPSPAPWPHHLSQALRAGPKDYPPRFVAGRQVVGWRRHLPFWLLSGAYVAARLTILNFQNTLNFYPQPNRFTEHAMYRLYTYLTTLPTGLRLWLWPADLHHERSWAVYATWRHPAVWGAALLVAGLLGAAWWARRRQPPVAVGLSWFFLATIPTSNLFVLINALFYDHWFLLPGLGLTLIAGDGLTWAWRGSARRRRAVTVASVAILALLAGLTWRYTQVWRTPRALYTHILRYEPASAKIQNNLGMALADDGQWMDAVRAYRRAIALDDEYPQTHHNLAQAYWRLGDEAGALAEFTTAVTMNPRFHHSWLALGTLHLQRREFAAAAEAFERAIAAYPYAADAYRGLAQARAAQGDTAGAQAALAEGRQVLQ